MKKILMSLFASALIFCSNSSSAQRVSTHIGNIENGTAVLTKNMETVLKVYNNKLLKYSQIDAKFTEVKLININASTYALVFSGGNFKSTIFVEVVGSQLMALASTSCTTSDPTCKNEPLGCVPKYKNPTDLYAYCTDCSNKDASCTKTTTSDSLIVD